MTNIMSLSAFLNTIPIIDKAPLKESLRTLAVIFAVLLVLGIACLIAVSKHKWSHQSTAISSFARFFYVSFLKPHAANELGSGQQAALESFYEAQVGSHTSVAKCAMLMGSYTRLAYTMQHGRGCSKDARICLVLLRAR